MKMKESISQFCFDHVTERKTTLCS